MRRNSGFWALPLALLGLVGCGDDANDAALDGAGGGSCTIEDKGDGTAVIRCPDGSEFTVSNGKPGADGKDGKDGESLPCTLTENEDGTHTLTCGDQSVNVGASCDEGFPGDLVVTKPEDSAAAFKLFLFEVSTCTWIRGDLVVAEYPNEELPKALARIERVDGGLGVLSNPALVSASFPRLTTVAGEIRFQGNAILKETSLPALETVGGDLRWLENPELVTVQEMPKLTEVGGYLAWGYSTKLERTPDFPELTSVGGNLVWGGNPVQVAVGAFPKLTTVGGLLAFQDNALLEDMGRYDALESVRGVLLLQNEVLEAVSDFPELVNVGTGGLVIANNPELTSIAGLGHIERVDGVFSIANNAKLPVCDVYELLTTIESRDGIGGAQNYSGNHNTDESCLPT